MTSRQEAQDKAKADQQTRQQEQHENQIRLAEIEMRKHLRDAEKSLRHAADICSKMASEWRRNGSESSGLRRAKDTQGIIDQCLGRIASIRPVVPLNERVGSEYSDSDRLKAFRASREAKRTADEAKKKLIAARGIYGSQE